MCGPREGEVDSWPGVVKQMLGGEETDLRWTLGPLMDLRDSMSDSNTTLQSMCAAYDVVAGNVGVVREERVWVEPAGGCSEKRWLVINDDRDCLLAGSGRENTGRKSHVQQTANLIG